MRINYSVPADFTENTLQVYSHLNQSCSTAVIQETYGQITVRTPYGSGRDLRLLPRVSMHRLKRYIQMSHDVGINFAYTLNSVCLDNRELLPHTREKLCKFLDLLEKAGVDTLIVAMPSLIELIKNKSFSFRLKASAVSQINQPYKAQIYRKLGVDSMVIDPDLVRNIPQLIAVSDAFQGETEMIVNNNCSLFCPYKTFHYCHETYSAKRHIKFSKNSYYFTKCNLMKYETASSFLKISWIRPEDTAAYEKCGVHNFKIQGRQDCIHGNVVKTVKAYLNRGFDGNLVELLTNFNAYHSFLPYINNRSLDNFIAPFFEKKFVCSGYCSQCHYCDSYVNKMKNVDELETISRLATEFYTQENNRY